MNTVGVFSGRGDVVLAMLFAVVVGGLIGWYTRGGKELVSQWLAKRGKRPSL